MGTEDRIVELIKKGKQLMEDQQFQNAKICFLDAADYALDESKDSSGKEKEKFKKYARFLVDFAKKAKEVEEDSGEPIKPPSINKDLGIEIEKVTPSTEPTTSDRDQSMSDIADPIFEKYPLGRKQSISVPMGFEGKSLRYWKPGNLET